MRRVTALSVSAYFSLLSPFTCDSIQFQDAITSTAGRTKLIDSMEGIVKSSQQVIVTSWADMMEPHAL